MEISVGLRSYLFIIHPVSLHGKYFQFATDKKFRVKRASVIFLVKYYKSPDIFPLPSFFRKKLDVFLFATGFFLLFSSLGFSLFP